MLEEGKCKTWCRSIKWSIHLSEKIAINGISTPEAHLDCDSFLIMSEIKQTRFLILLIGRLNRTMSVSNPPMAKNRKGRDLTGIFLLNKDKSMSSNYALQKVKEFLMQRKPVIPEV